jgi:beta-lactamase superfamily II metal-dependent hydrolase
MTDSFSISMLPARDGDCLFVEAAGFRLLIDGGRSEIGLTVLPAFIGALPARPGKPTIDLMILTHVDADHVAGLLTFLATLGKVSIGEVWFNGVEHHKRATGAFIKPHSLDNLAPRRPPETGTLSVDQALQFDVRINSLGIPWNATLKGAAVMVEPEGKLPRISLTEGLDLVLLGPPRKKLADFYPEWEKYVRTFDTTKVLSGESRTKPTVNNVKDLALEPVRADTTSPNGASIAFVLEAGNKRVLFTADAHPGDVASGLERYAGPGRVWFDAVKVAHHGSAKNNTAILIDRLQSPNWLISTDGSGHGHPNVPPIARILLAPSDGKLLVFNYRSNANADWDNDDLRKAFKYSTFYGNGKTAVRVNI